MDFMIRLGLRALLLWLFAASVATADDAPDLTSLRQAADAGDPAAMHELGVALAPQADSVEKQAELVRLWRTSAEAGYAPAKNEMGMMLLTGKMLPQDAGRAITMFEESAAGGHGEAFHNLGWVYTNGNGVTQDMEKGIAYYRSAVEANVAQSQLNLGLHYLQGVGVQADAIKAKELLTLAAEQGKTTAMLQLGANLVTGDVLGQDVVAGLNWLAKSAEAGNVNAAYSLGTGFETGEYFDKDLNEAKRWYAMAADAGAALAAYRLGVLLDDSDGSPELAEAVKRYRQAAQAGQADAQYQMYQYYRDGLGVEKDSKLARQWLQQAASTGNLMAKLSLEQDIRAEERLNSVPQEVVAKIRRGAEQGGGASQARLGEMYYRGEGLAKDREEAIRWLTAAAEQGVVRAMADLGGALQDREADDTQRRQALSWIEAAAEAGDILSQYRWGVALLGGQRLDQDPQQAAMWFRRSAEQNYTEAKVATAYMLFSGTGGKRDLGRAAQWIAALDERVYGLALNYRDGDDGLPADKAFAHVLYGHVLRQYAEDDSYRINRYQELGDELSKKERRASEKFTAAIEKVGENHADRWREQLDLAYDLVIDSKRKEADKMLADARRSVRKISGKAHFNEAELLAEQATLALIRGEDGRKRSLQREALETVENHPETPRRELSLRQRTFLGQLSLHDAKQALAMAPAALELAQKTYGGDAEQVGDFLHSWGKMLLRDNRPEEALSYVERAIEVRRQAPTEFSDSELEKFQKTLTKALDAMAEKNAGSKEAAEIPGASSTAR
ncbi:MAG: SEL1-like repeat protein [Pseudomonadota bacterium]